MLSDKIGEAVFKAMEVIPCAKFYSPDQDENAVVECCMDKTEEEYNLCIIIEIKEAFPANAVMPALQG